jgi:hypothetical protein
MHVETHGMNLIPFASPVANLILITGYAVITGAAAYGAAELSFALVDSRRSRRR